MTLHCWIEYSYYDGMWCFAQVCGRLDPQGPVRHAEVRWLNSAWSATSS